MRELTKNPLKYRSHISGCHLQMRLCAHSGKYYAQIHIGASLLIIRKLEPAHGRDGAARRPCQVFRCVQPELAANHGRPLYLNIYNVLRAG